MPELPEVRTVARVLNNKIKGCVISDVLVRYSRIVEDGSLDLCNLIGKRINNIVTYGKYLIFCVDDLYLISHLRMEGKYYIKCIDEEYGKHEHVVFTLDNNISLRYHDTRKFGRMFLTDNIDSYKGLNKLGYEVFDDRLDKFYLYNKIYRSNLTIKELLLNQNIMAGLGNIYVNEVLFRCRINPYTKGRDITIDDCLSIIDNSRLILGDAIRDGGTTIRSYTSSLGVTGRYQDKLCVHMRENMKCLVCGSVIRRDMIKGRSTYYCPMCQK